MDNLHKVSYKLAGYDSVQSFVENMKSESEQLKAFLNFIKNNNIISFLQKKDWAGFACKYNGLGYKANQYDKKLQKAYGKI